MSPFTWASKNSILQYETTDSAATRAETKVAVQAGVDAAIDGAVTSIAAISVIPGIDLTALTGDYAALQPYVPLHLNSSLVQPTKDSTMDATWAPYVVLFDDIDSSSRMAAGFAIGKIICYHQAVSLFMQPIIQNSYREAVWLSLAAAGGSGFLLSLNTIGGKAEEMYALSGTEAPPSNFDVGVYCGITAMALGIIGSVLASV